MVSDELKKSLEDAHKNRVEGEHNLYDELRDAIEVAIPHFIALGQLLQERIKADPPEKYDGRVMRTRKALGE